MSSNKMFLTEMSIFYVPYQNVPFFTSPFSGKIRHTTSVIDTDNAIFITFFIRHILFAWNEMMNLFIGVSVIRHSSIAVTEKIQLFKMLPASLK